MECSLTERIALLMEHIYKCRACKQTFIEHMVQPRTYGVCPKCGEHYWDWLNWSAIADQPLSVAQDKKKFKRRRKR